MKRGKRMVLMLLALLVCIGGYWGVQQIGQESSTVNETSGNFTLAAYTADELTGLKWQNGEEMFNLTLSDGTWTNAADPAFPLDQTAVQDMADDLLTLQGTRQLDGVTDLSIYGLQEPTFTVTASWSDGTETTYALGDETPFGDGYYLSLGHEGIVYTIASDISTSFDTAMNDLAVLEAIPSVTAADRLTVGTQLDIVKEETSRTINEDEVWYDTFTGAALDADAAEDLLSDAQGITWAALEEATATDAELETFGLTEALATTITLYEGDTAALTLLIGGQNDSGNYYARLPGSAMVYTVSSSKVSGLLSATAEDMPSMTMLNLTADNVQAATFTAGEAVYHWVRPEETASEDAAADEAAESTETTVDETWEQLWSSLLALTPSKAVTEETNGTVMLTVTVEATNGQTAELVFSEYDAESYAVQVLERCFLVDAGDVDAIIRTLRNYSKG